MQHIPSYSLNTRISLSDLFNYTIQQKSDFLLDSQSLSGFRLMTGKV